jgi:hypothetical protein
MLQYDVTISKDAQKTPLPGFASFSFDVTTVADTRLLRFYLAAWLNFRQRRQYYYRIEVLLLFRMDLEGKGFSLI